MAEQATARPGTTRRVAITGANGLIGSRVSAAFESDESWSDTIRLRRCKPDNGVQYRQSPELTASEGWYEALSGADAVVHCAARAHVLKETADADTVAAQFHAMNCDGAVCVARSALALGVRHFVFISSAGVVAGEAAEQPALEHTRYSPLSPYAEAKAEAERQLITLFEDSKSLETCEDYGPCPACCPSTRSLASQTNALSSGAQILLRRL